MNVKLYDCVWSWISYAHLRDVTDRINGASWSWLIYSDKVENVYLRVVGRECQLQQCGDKGELQARIVASHMNLATHDLCTNWPQIKAAHAHFPFPFPFQMLPSPLLSKAKKIHFYALPSHITVYSFKESQLYWIIQTSNEYWYTDLMPNCRTHLR